MDLGQVLCTGYPKKSSISVIERRRGVFSAGNAEKFAAKLRRVSRDAQGALVLRDNEATIDFSMASGDFSVVSRF